MNNTKLAAAVGVGYLLGRLHKARWALTLAGMAAGKKISSNPRVLLGQLLETSPELRRLADEVRGELAEAGMKAATAAAGHRIGDLTEQIHQRTESLRDKTAQRDDESDDEPEDTEQEDTEQESEGSEKKGRSRTTSKSSRSGTGSRSRGTSTTTARR